jgi:hypothetical protein
MKVHPRHGPKLHGPLYFVSLGFLALWEARRTMLYGHSSSLWGQSGEVHVLGVGISATAMGVGHQGSAPSSPNPTVGWQPSPGFPLPKLSCCWIPEPQNSERS